MTIARLELIKQHIDSLPVLPTTVTRLMKLTRDPESSAKDIMETILPDQSLCFTILKIANSAFFGRPKKVDSIQMAVAVLGFNEVQNIALTKALINSFSKIDEKYKLIVDKFWEHSFVCGIAARFIAQDLQIAPDVASMGGLIHDVGKLIMLETFDDDYDIQLWMANFTDEKVLQEEHKAFSFTHDHIGGQLMEEWNFPDNLITAVANHHHPADASDENALANVVQLADFLSFYCCNEASLGEYDILTEVYDSLPNLKSSWRNLGLTIDDESISRWFNWLIVNREQASSLKSSFS
jgi:putative nucleotidyltransferase with HDIG domain